MTTPNKFENMKDWDLLTHNYVLILNYKHDAYDMPEFVACHIEILKRMDDQLHGHDDE